MFARYTFDDAAVAVPDGIDLVRADSTSRNQYLTAEVNYIKSDRLLNTFRFSVNDSESGNGNTFLHTVDPSLSFFPGTPLGQISVTGFFSIGPSRFGPSFSDMRLYQFTDDVSFFRGRQSIRIGVDYRFYQLATSRPQSPYGFYQFNGLTNFLQKRPGLGGADAARLRTGPRLATVDDRRVLPGRHPPQPAADAESRVYATSA